MVEVVTSEVGIAVGGHYLEETVTKVHDRDIECTATEVEHSNLHALVHLVKTECESGCSRLVHDTLHIESGNLSGLLGSLPL